MRRAFGVTMLGAFAVAFAAAWIEGAIASAGSADPGSNADQELAPVVAAICTAVAATTWLFLVALDRVRGHNRLK